MGFGRRRDQGAAMREPNEKGDKTSKYETALVYLGLSV
jgi:hypothetical protein